MTLWARLGGFLTFLWKGIVVPLLHWHFDLFQMVNLWHAIFHPQPPVVSPTYRIVFQPGVPYTVRPARSIQFTAGTPVTQSRYQKEP